MQATGAGPVRSQQDFKKTYRYLRIGILGAVLLLGVSILLERRLVDCWQTSISAYYYTPVRAVFVGSLLAVGLSLIVYKGRSADRWTITIAGRHFHVNLEDICLNFAGVFAPVVAIAPTVDVGTCWSRPPEAFPVRDDGSLAGWVTTNIANNFTALVLAGLLMLVVAVVLTMVLNRSVAAPVRNVERGTSATLAVTGLLLIVGWLLYLYWDDFNRAAHGRAAFLMFAFLIGAIVAVARQHRKANNARWKRYAVLAAAMALGGALIAYLPIFGDHTVFAVEIYEIGLFFVYWLAQTVENWDEQIGPGTR